jgi:23S rRNA pseudouridine1911/1915/1917 synthase
MDSQADHHQIIVAPGKTPVRIDQYIATALKAVSRSRIRKLIDEHQILVDGKPIKASHIIIPNEVIDITLPTPKRFEAVAQDIPLDIIYQDEEIAVINKQTDIIVHPSPDTPDGTLVNALLHHVRDLSGINGVQRPGIVHRLDKNTTGLLVISKTDNAHRHLSRQFATRTMEKRYLAVVWGTPRKDDDVIDKPLKRNRKDFRQMVVDADGRDSVTEYSVREHFRILSLMEARPKTGRTHQIRVHFKSIGHPIFGDLLYDGRETRLKRQKSMNRGHARRMLELIERQSLHAWRLKFEHPSTGEYVEFTAEPPADFQNLLAYLREHCAIDETQPGEQ